MEARLEGAFRFATCLLRLLEIDLGRHVGGLRHHDDLVRPDLHEAADDGERFLLALAADAQLADAEGRQERRVVRQHPELAVAAGQHDGVDGLAVREPLRRDDLEEEWHVYAFSLAALAFTSSSVPARKKACSGSV